MISKLHLYAAALAGFMICSVAGAQVRSGTSVVRHSSNRTKPSAKVAASATPSAARGSQANRSTNVIQISSSGRISSESAPEANAFSFDSFSGVPGLGFDFPHLAAISGSLRNNPHVFGHGGQRGQDAFVPIFFGGYPYYVDDTGADQQDQPAAQPQPQIIVIQQPVPAQQAADSGSNAGSTSALAAESEAAASVPDAGDFILVRRDGRILFASVFSVVGAQLQYVTPEGIRRAVAMADLDSEATEQMNEARGTTVTIHD